MKGRRHAGPVDRVPRRHVEDALSIGVRRHDLDVMTASGNGGGGLQRDDTRPAVSGRQPAADVEDPQRDGRAFREPRNIERIIGDTPRRATNEDLARPLDPSAGSRTLGPGQPPPTDLGRARVGADRSIDEVVSLNVDRETTPGRRILVTGGSGFIGTNIVERFVTDGNTVLNVDIAAPKDPRQVPFWRMVDIMDPAALDEAFAAFRPDVVIHLAARADLDERHDLAGYATNIQGVSNVIASIIAVGTVERTFFASSRLVFDLGYVPKHERDYHASTLYGQSKAEGEELVRTAPTQLGTWTILRPTGIWGPWFSVPYYDFFQAIRRGVYVHPGRRDVRKAYGFVENTAYQVQRLASRPPTEVHGKTFWVADYPPVVVREWAHLIQKATGARPLRTLPVPILKVGALVGDAFQRLGLGHAPLTSFRLNNMVSDMLYDTGPLEQLVGPLPFRLEEGVARTVAWLDRDPTRQANDEGG